MAFPLALLASASSQVWVRRCHLPWKKIAVWVLVLSANALTARGQDACMADLPVYGPEGRRLATKIGRVSPAGHSGVNLSGRDVPASVRVEVYDGRRLVFPKGLLGKQVEVVFEAVGIRSVAFTVRLFACRQRTSFRIGLREGFGDTSALTVSGRLTGCATAGDWWVRAMPMFGGQGHPSVFEGMVEETGAFQLSGAMDGERHILVIGKDAQTLKVVPFDVVEGKRNEVGAIDLRRECPVGNATETRRP